MSSFDVMQFSCIGYDMSLFDILSGYSYRALNASRKNFGISSNDFRNKGELIKLIGDAIQSKYEESIPMLDYERYNIIRSIAEGNDTWEYDSGSLCAFVTIGMALEYRSRNDITHILPDELITEFRKMDSQSLADRVKQNSSFYELINGCIMSYGLIDSVTLMKIVKEHAEFEFNDIRFREAMDGCEALHGGILVDEPLVYSRCFIEPDYYIDEQAKVAEFDYKEFSKEEIIRAGDWLHVPDKECYRKIIEMLIRYFKCDYSKSHASAAILINYAKACRVLDETMDYIVKELGPPTDEFMKEFVPLYCVYNNCTGKWALKGHTPNEITKIKNPELHELMQENMSTWQN